MPVEGDLRGLERSRDVGLDWGVGAVHRDVAVLHPAHQLHHRSFNVPSASNASSGLVSQMIPTQTTAVAGV